MELRLVAHIKQAHNIALNIGIDIAGEINRGRHSGGTQARVSPFEREQIHFQLPLLAPLRFSKR